MIGGSLVSEGLGVQPEPVLLYAAIGVGALILAIVKLVEHSRMQKIGEPAALPVREEPVLEPVVAAEPVRDEDALEEPVPDVQQSTPKRRAPRRKSARKANASPQG